MSKDELQQIEKFAGMALSMEQVGIVMDAEPNDWAREMQSKGEAYRAYMKGFLMNEVAIRASVMDLAKNGSAPAQVEALRMISDAKCENIGM